MAFVSLFIIIVLILLPEALKSGSVTVCLLGCADFLAVGVVVHHYGWAERLVPDIRLAR